MIQIYSLVDLFIFVWLFVKEQTGTAEYNNTIREAFHYQNSSNKGIEYIEI